MQRKVAAGSNKATNPRGRPPLPLCDHCQQPAQPGKRLLVCSSCHEACYCSPEHQVADWIYHKVLCKQRKKEKKKEKEREKERKESDAAINYLLLNPPIAAHPTAAELFAVLWGACNEGEVGRARQILLSGAYIACQQGHTKCLSLLINHGVDCSKTTDDGSGPVHIACHYGHFECVKSLLDRGKVDVNCTTTINRQTPAFKCCIAGHVKILHLFIQHGADLSLANMTGESPAHVASVYGRVKMLALINIVNADLINQCNNQGRTPLLYARQSSQNGAAEYLIEHGAEEAGEPLGGIELEAIEVQLIQMHSIISHKALQLSHIIFSLYGRVNSRRTRKRLDCWIGV
jgi:ankyrin repeat protein